MNTMVMVKCLLLALVEITAKFTAAAISNYGGHPIIGDIGGHPIITHQNEELSRCPWACSCAGLTIDCSQHGLPQVPQKLPSDAEKL
ncbi:hypothetical protein RUM44_001487 [Polyplax serrata]